MCKRFAVVAEAAADFQTAIDLADRVLMDSIKWLDASLLDSQRVWLGNESTSHRLSWQSIPSAALRLDIRVHGHFDGKPGLADAKAARRAIIYAQKIMGPLDAILLIRDRDDQHERHDGLEQARREAQDRSEAQDRIAIIIGLAIPEREAWVIAGFMPVTDEETESLQTERRLLGFDPCLQSHQLTAGKNDNANRSPKRVLEALTQGDSDRKRSCWIFTELQVLRDRGLENGLASYLDEIRTRLVPFLV